MSAHSRSLEDPLRSGNVFTDIFCHRSIKDVRDGVRTCRMGTRTIRTVTEERRMRYGRATDINYRNDPQSLYRKLKHFDFSRSIPIDSWHYIALQMLGMAVQVKRMICKSLNIFQIRNPAVILRYIRLCVTGV